jgi:hypothetical protein
MEKIDINRLTIGFDVEFFLQEKETGKPYSAIGLIPGSKDEPHPIEEKCGCCIQTDNVACEVNVNPSNLSSHEETWNEFNILKQCISALLPKNLEINKNSSLHFDNKFLKHPKAIELGCSPDYNLWKLEVNPRPDASGKTLRTAALHIHLASPDIKTDDYEFLKVVALFVEIPGVILDGDLERKSLYGMSGSFRPRTYSNLNGYELRTLGNYAFFDEESLKNIYDNVKAALVEYNNGFRISDELANTIQKCVNTNDIDIAYTLIEDYNICLPKTENVLA